VTHATIDERLRILLPPEYHESYERLEAKPMGSAGLSYDTEGRVAWDRIWQSFCDLAMAGGPPHKGALLGPGTPENVAAQPDRYLDVIEELGRGITLASELPAADSPDLGWIRVQCHSDVMAGWMLRAITMENVAVRADGRALDLPASPHFRLDKEIKNVVTVVAKTAHYWMGHLPREQKIAIGALFESLASESPLIQPDWADASCAWRGLNCASVADAIWMARALIASNVLARRERTMVFVPASVHEHQTSEVSAMMRDLHEPVPRIATPAHGRRDRAHRKRDPRR
jgi:sirohydrochlorin cobaltochelatase